MHITTIEVVTIGMMEKQPVSQAIALLNALQTTFLFKAFDVAELHEYRGAQLHRFRTVELYKELHRIARSEKGYHDLMIGVVGRQLDGEKLGNLFGSMETGENGELTGKAITTVFQVEELLDQIPMAVYLATGFLSFAIRFTVGSGMIHDNERGCLFHRKVEKRDILDAIKSGYISQASLVRINERLSVDQVIEFKTILSIVGAMARSDRPKVALAQQLATLEISDGEPDVARSGEAVEIDQGAVPKTECVDHVVLLVHGIRDYGSWQQSAQELIEKQPGMKAVCVSFGYYDAISFVSFLGNKAGPYETLLEAYDQVSDRYSNALVSIVAHSFGTYLVGKLIEENPRTSLHRILLCGSVLPRDFPWHDFTHRFGVEVPKSQAAIVNECGTSDVWPVVAKTASARYGDVGRRGFANDVYATTRWFRGKHGVFLKPGHIRDNWLPFLSAGVIDSGNANQPSALILERIAATLPIAWLAFGVVAVMLLVRRFWWAILIISLLLVWWIASSTLSLLLSKPLGFEGAANSQPPFELEDFAWIPPGDFVMGSPAKEIGRGLYEDQEKKRVPSGFFLAKCEVTTEQYHNVMNLPPVSDTSGQKPMTDVSWDDAVGFCEELTLQHHETDRLPHEYRYTLPTETEWEYACRAGSENTYCFGNATARLHEYAWFTPRTAGTPTKVNPVGRKRANAWGVYDMHGNVAEWCDAVEPKQNGKKAVRGGAAGQVASECRSANRVYQSKNYKSESIGFRVAAVPIK